MARISQFKGELSRQVVALGYRFVQRWDIHARQQEDGTYVCVRKPLSVDHIFAHLNGYITLGTYLLNQKHKTRFMALDTDDEQGFSRLELLARALAGEKMYSYLEKSRRGGHLWIFLPKAFSGKDVRAFGRGLLKAHNFDDVELFPKQDKLNDGPGSLIRMPFGVHRVSGQRYGFYFSNGKPLAPTIREQINALSAPEMVSETLFQHYQCVAPAEVVKHSQKPSRNPRSNNIDQIKKSISVFDFVTQYVELKPISNGAIGLCPFHNDHKPSFSVNIKENYWNCFAGCGSGSIIDFWMKWQGCDFITAIKELTHKLL